jgi:hypothetical protein
MRMSDRRLFRETNSRDKAERTSKDRQNRFMDRLDLLLLQYITRKQGKHQQHDQDEKSPGAEELLLSGFRSIWNSSSATDPRGF